MKTFALDLGNTYSRVAMVGREGRSWFVTLQATGPGPVWSRSTCYSRRLSGTAKIMGTPSTTVMHPIRLAGLSAEQLVALNPRYVPPFFETDTGLVKIDANGMYPDVDDVLAALLDHSRVVAQHADPDMGAVVLTVPDGSSAPRRTQLMGAAAQAGLEVRAMIDQTSAAALAVDPAEHHVVAC